MPDYTRPRFAATVIVPGFELVGQIEPVGPWTDFLNAHDKYTLPMVNTRVLPIGTAPGSTSERAQVFALRSQVQLIHLPERAAHETIYMLKNAQIAICHVGPLICRGELHMGVDATLATFLDDQTGNFFPMTNVELFSTTALPVALPRKADLVLLNRTQIQLYYPA